MLNFPNKKPWITASPTNEFKSIGQIVIRFKMEFIKRLWTDTEEEGVKEREIARETASEVAEEIYKQSMNEFYEKKFPEIRGRSQNQTGIAYRLLESEGDFVFSDTVGAVANDLFQDRLKSRKKNYKETVDGLEETLKEFAEFMLDKEDAEKTKGMLGQLVSAYEEGVYKFYRTARSKVGYECEKTKKLGEALVNVNKSYKELCSTFPLEEYSLPLGALEIVESVPKMSKRGLEGLQTIMSQEIYEQ